MTLTVAYDEKPAIWDIDLAVPEGVLMGIVGPNGAGKSTLIKSVLNLIPRAAGTVSFYGKPYERARSSSWLCAATRQRRLGFPDLST